VTDEHARRIGVVHTAIGQIQRQLRHTPFSGILHLDELPEVHDPKLLAVVNEEHIAAYKKIIHDSLAAAVDSRANLVFLHLPVPHPIGIYNRDTGAFDSTGARDYFDNVTLADHALGEIRRAMEAAGLWDRSAVLVTADHPLRVELWATEPGWSPMSARSTGNRSHPLVPFLWKAPGQTTAAAYDGAFNTVMTDRLMLAYLRGEAAGPLGVVRWLEANRNSVPVE